MATYGNCGWTCELYRVTDIKKRISKGVDEGLK